MAPQTNEKKLISWSQVDPVHCLEQASALCRCTVRTSRWSWINEKNNNLAPLPMWKNVHSVRIGVTRCVRIQVCVSTPVSYHQHLSRSKHVCLDASVQCGRLSEVVSCGPPTALPFGHRCTVGVLPGPSGVLQRGKEPTRCLEAVCGRVRGRARERRVCVQLRILTPLLDWSSQSYSFSVTSSVSFVSFVPSVPLVPSGVAPNSLRVYPQDLF